MFLSSESQPQVPLVVPLPHHFLWSGGQDTPSCSRATSKVAPNEQLGAEQAVSHAVKDYAVRQPAVTKKWSCECDVIDIHWQFKLPASVVSDVVFLHPSY